MPFPAALARAGARSPVTIPWLVAVNGWASVVGAVLASLVAVAWGFPAVALAAAALYAMAAVLIHRRRQP
jgi:hypothetical protein